MRPVRLESATSQSQGKRSTTEPLRYHKCCIVENLKFQADKKKQLQKKDGKSEEGTDKQPDTADDKSSEATGTTAGAEEHGGKLGNICETCLKQPLKNRQNKDLNDKW